MGYPHRRKHHQRRHSPHPKYIRNLYKGYHPPLGIACYTVGVAKEAFGSQVFIGHPYNPLNKVCPLRKQNKGQPEEEKKNGIVYKVNAVDNQARKGVEGGQPVIEQPVSGITIESAPKNGGPEAYPAQQYEYGGVRDPGQKREAVLKKQIRERAGEQKDRQGAKPKVNKEGFY